MKYYLIGLPGCGKTTVGKELAKNLKFEFYDIDKMIKDEYGDIPSIFKEYGEEYFRNLETKMLQKLEEYDECVISCGGGIVEKTINKDYMNGLVIYLEVPLDEIKRRIGQNTSSRPLMKNNSVEDLYERRKNKYLSFSTFSIKNQIISTAIKEIKKESKKYGK